VLNELGAAEILFVSPRIDGNEARIMYSVLASLLLRREVDGFLFGKRSS
jgi:hypothetical protein